MAGGAVREAAAVVVGQRSLGPHAVYTSLQQQVDYLIDVSRITATLNRYAMAFDWLSPDLLDQVLLDDADIDFGFFKVSGAVFKLLLMELKNSHGRRWHFSSQISADFQGNGAWAQSYNISLSSPEMAATAGTEVGECFG